MLSGMSQTVDPKVVDSLRARLAKSKVVVDPESVLKKRDLWIIFDEPIIVHVERKSKPMRNMYVNCYYPLKNVLARYGIDISRYYIAQTYSTKVLLALPPKAQELLLGKNLMMVTAYFYQDARGSRGVKVRVPRPVYDCLMYLTDIGVLDSPHMLIVGIARPPQ